MNGKGVDGLFFVGGGKEMKTSDDTMSTSEYTSHNKLCLQ